MLLGVSIPNEMNVLECSEIPLALQDGEQTSSALHLIFPFTRLEVLNMSSGIDDGADEFLWQLALCLLLAWVVIFLCLVKGIKSSGKVLLLSSERDTAMTYIHAY